MIFSIEKYGAKTDGALCTFAIQKAIDECFLSGGGEVVIPKGVWRTGGLRLRSNVMLHLMENAVLEGSQNPEDYLTYLEDSVEPIDEKYITEPVSTTEPDGTSCASVYPCSRWNNAIIRVIDAQNVSIIGEKGSIIDGKNCYDELGEEGYRGPHAINMWYCKNVTLKGYTIKDSANWAHAIQNSQNIMATNLTVLAGHDGFDVRTCDNILIENCRFYSGDDCIAGFDNIEVTIKNCEFSSACNLLRFGGTNVLVENCTSILPAKYGHRFGLSDEQKRLGLDCDENCRFNCETAFMYYCDYRAKVRKTPGNIVLRNCNFSGADCLFRLDFGHVWCRNRSLDNITFESCRFENVCEPIKVKAPENETILIKMKNCFVSAREGFENISFVQLENCREFIREGTMIENFDVDKI